MTRADLLALAERVEAASGPDRDLNEAVLLVVGWSVINGWLCNPEGHRAFGAVPDVTASLDAAMSLVPEGHRQPSDIMREALLALDKRFNLHMSWWPLVTPYGEYLARCVTAAALKARAAQIGDV